MPKVFVYGTLKRRFPLHEPAGLPLSLFLGLYETAEPYPMLIAGSIYGPMMFDEPGKGFRMRGELYDVAPDRLAALDAAEDVEQPGSFRSTLRVRSLDGGADVAEAICFFKRRQIAHPVHSGYIADYQDRRFVPPWERP